MDAMAVGEQLMQLDQAITLTLQEIDEHFSQAHQLVTGKILPAIRAYEASCAETWQAARFWKQFFEASAQVSLTQQPLEPLESDDAAEAVPPGAVLDDASHRTRDSDELQTPPRLTRRDLDGDMPSTPFERLKRDVEASAQASMRHVDGEASVVHDPSLTWRDVPKSSSPWKGRSRRVSARPRVSVVGGAGSDELAALNPFQAGEPSTLWNGIADLRTTPLRSAVPRARPSLGSEEDVSLQMPEGMSPPVSVPFSVPPSAYLKTPAKEAARRVVEDLLQSVGGARAAPESGGRRKSVVGTPLVRRASHRRDSLPTPPTITKVYAPPAGEREEPGVSTHRLMDRDEDGPIEAVMEAHLPTMMRHATLEVRGGS